MVQQGIPERGSPQLQYVRWVRSEVRSGHDSPDEPANDQVTCRSGCHYSGNRKYKLKQPKKEPRPAVHTSSSLLDDMLHNPPQPERT